MDDETNTLAYSVVTLWETTIKHALDRPDFNVDSRDLRRELSRRGWEELPVTGEHALAVGNLPTILKDPFDRLLIAQATIESIALLTSDSRLARYGRPVHLV